MFKHFSVGLPRHWDERSFVGSKKYPVCCLCSLTLIRLHWKQANEKEGG